MTFITDCIESELTLKEMKEMKKDEILEILFYDRNQVDHKIA